MGVKTSTCEFVGETLRPTTGRKPLEGFEQVNNIIIGFMFYKGSLCFVEIRMKGGSRGIAITEAGDDVCCARC